MKLEKITKSTVKSNKYTASFSTDDAHTKKVHFGSTGFLDYTIGATEEQRKSYRARHKKDLDTKDPTRAGYLSYYLLWGNSTSLNQNIKDYKKRFNL
jgi:hypothetical protein